MRYGQYGIYRQKDKDKGVLTQEEHKVARRVFYEEWKDKRPHCLHCGEQLTASFHKVLVQVFEPIPEKTLTEKDRWGNEHEMVIEADDGIRARSDYRDPIGFGWREQAQFCTGVCAQHYARRAVDVLKKLGKRLIPMNQVH